MLAHQYRAQRGKSHGRVVERVQDDRAVIDCHGEMCRLVVESTIEPVGMSGNDAAAHDAYLVGARLTTSLPQQRYLHAQAARLAPGK